MASEVLLQQNMFTGELDDNRTRIQKQQDRQRALPQQTEMFSQRDIAQFGVNARPLLPLSPNTKLLLIPEDPRTEEEIERDREREAEGLTHPLFEASSLPVTSDKAGEYGGDPSRALVAQGVVAVVVFQEMVRSLMVIPQPKEGNGVV